MKPTKNKRFSIRDILGRLHLLISVVSLLLCGFIMFFSTKFIMNNFISTEIEYYQQKTATDLFLRTNVLENIVITLRNDPNLIKYLRQVNTNEPTEAILSSAQNGFLLRTDLYTNSNILESGKPFLERLYLFDNNGIDFNVCYYPLTSDEATRQKEYMLGIYKDFNMAKKLRKPDSLDYMFINKDGYIYLCWDFFDNFMTQMGTLVFAVSHDSINEVMKQSQQYQGTKWIISDKAKNVIATNIPENVLPKETEWLLHSGIGDNEHEYIIDYTDLSMNLRSVVAVPKNQVNLLLYSSIKNYAIWVIVIIIISSSFILLTTYKLTKPLGELSAKISLVGQGIFGTKLPEYQVLEFDDISKAFNSMTDHIDHLVKEVYEKQLIIREEELRFMQSQMNPHFMFNVLNTIALNVKLNGDDETADILTSFSRLIQATIFRRNEDKILISDELKYVEYYLNLQRYRYGDRLSFSLDMDDESVIYALMPKLCMQLIVENAVVHGIEAKAGICSIMVSIKREDNDVIISVKDNGIGFDMADENGYVSLPIRGKSCKLGHNRIALNNANDIIKIMYGEKYGIVIFSEAGKGSTVTVNIPYDRYIQQEKNGGNQCSYTP